MDTILPFLCLITKHELNGRLNSDNNWALQASHPALFPAFQQ
jgi:hypothetical protein